MALAKTLPCLKIEIVKRWGHAKGFAALQRRWAVERTFEGAMQLIFPPWRVRHFDLSSRS